MDGKERRDFACARADTCVRAGPCRALLWQMGRYQANAFLCWWCWRCAGVVSLGPCRMVRSFVRWMVLDSNVITIAIASQHARLCVSASQTCNKHFCSDFTRKIILLCAHLPEHFENICCIMHEAFTLLLFIPSCSLSFSLFGRLHFWICMRHWLQRNTDICACVLLLSIRFVFHSMYDVVVGCLAATSFTCIFCFRSLLSSLLVLSPGIRTACKLPLHKWCTYRDWNCTWYAKMASTTAHSICKPLCTIETKITFRYSVIFL